ncbi:MAG: hypothetical protein K2J65_02665 [Duncaniella sp.]|nr:hypothetical protein [Duncaniella sp.]
MTNRNDIEWLFKAQMHKSSVAFLRDDDLACDIFPDVFVSLLDAPLEIIVTSGYLIKAVRNRSLNYIRDCEIANRYFLENKEFDSWDCPDEETIVRVYSLIKSEISPQARCVMEFLTPIIFDNEPLEKIMKEVADVYDVEIKSNNKEAALSHLYYKFDHRYRSTRLWNNSAHSNKSISNKTATS